jgi:hypothetical protein
MYSTAINTSAVQALVIIPPEKADIFEQVYRLASEVGPEISRSTLAVRRPTRGE